MANNFCRCDAAHPGASNQIQLAGKTEHKSRRIGISGAGGVGQGGDRLRIDDVDFIARHNDRTPFASRQRGNLAMAAHPLQGGVETFNLIKRYDLFFVCEQNIDVMFGQIEKILPVAVDAKGNGNALKIPHMGWNRVIQKRDHPLWKGIESGERFYFVHSYYVQPSNPVDTAAICNHVVDFTAVVAKENLFATQFHPEKSQQAGLGLLSNFFHWKP